jgi:hypothetical protein
MNLEGQSLNQTEKDSYATLTLDRIAVDAGETLVAYMVVAPVELSGWDVKLAITSEDGDEVDFDIRTDELKAGRLYILSTTECEEKAFSSKHYASSLSEPCVGVADIPIDTDSQIIVTGIHQTEYDKSQNDGTIYTLSGIRARQSSQKGIIIKNRKKVIQ